MADSEQSSTVRSKSQVNWTNQFVYAVEKKEGGRQRFQFDIPDPECLTVVASDINGAVLPESPEELATKVHRVCDLIRICIVLFTAVRENGFKEDVLKIARDFEKLYYLLCHKVREPLLAYFDILTLFRESFLYYAEEKKAFGERALKEMKVKMAATKLDLKEINTNIKKLEKKVAFVQKTVEKMSSDMSEHGSDVHETYEYCISECTNGISLVRSFLEQLVIYLGDIDKVFDLNDQIRNKRANMKECDFKKLTASCAFMGEINRTVYRCAVAKKLSNEYASRLKSKMSHVEQMVSTVLTHRVARERIVRLVEEFNRNPWEPIDKTTVENLKAVDWGKLDEAQKASDRSKQKSCLDMLEAEEKIRENNFVHHHYIHVLFRDKPTNDSICIIL